METQNIIRGSGGSDGAGPDINRRPIAQEDLPSIRLSPEQIEEIHADEYSLKIFYATRVQALTLGEIKRKFPEPTPKKAQSVLSRYVECGLVHITNEGKYYSNYPRNYINYSDYKYDADLEAKKDAKVFELMKEFTGQPEYWSTKSYFSIDSFFTPEQTQELKAMFTEIKYKAKQFSNDNAMKGKVDGLNFRRLKFYDMILSVLLVIFVMAMPVKQAFAGNDPGQPMSRTNIYPISLDEFVDKLISGDVVAAGGGNDPGIIRSMSALPISTLLMKASFEVNAAGGGHDPGYDSGAGRAGGGHDPGVTRDNEECAKQLYDAEGELLDVDVKCLEESKSVMIKECLNGEDFEYCKGFQKIREVESLVDL